MNQCIKVYEQALNSRKGINVDHQKCNKLTENEARSLAAILSQRCSTLS